MPNTFKILTYRAFEPTEILGLKAWYDASTLTGADGSSVSAWLDQSGNEAHMYQSTSAAQPTLQTNELNGRNVVRFDGVDDFMNLTAPFNEIPTNRETASATNNIRFSSTGNYLIYLQRTSPSIFLYKRNGNNFSRISFTSPFSDVVSATWSPNDEYLVISSATTSPFIKIYKRSGDTFTALSDPATIPDGAVYGKIDFSSDGVYLAIPHAGTRRLTIYKRSGDTFTKLSDPTTLPTGTGTGCSFSNNADFLAVGHLNSPRISIYQRSGDVFTKVGDPADLPAADVYGIDFSSNSTYLAICGFSTPKRLIIYKNTSGVFTKLSDPLIDLDGIGFSCEFSNDENFLFFAHAGTRRLTAYSRSGDTFTKLNDPASLPNSQGVGLTLSNNLLAFASTSSPFIQAYTFDGTTLTNLTKLNMFRNVGGASIFAVVKYSGGASSQAAFFASNNTTANPRTYLYQRFSGTNVKYTIAGRRLDADLFQALQSITESTNIFVLHTGVIDYSNSNAFVYLNGSINNSTTSFQTDGLTSNTDSSVIQISNAAIPNYMNGDIAEIIVFNRALTTAEIANVHEYLSRKWGIALA